MSLAAETDDERKTRPIVAVSTGDPAGVGPEVAVAAACSETVLRQVRPLLVGHRQHLLGACEARGMQVELVRCRADEGTDPCSNHNEQGMPVVRYVQPVGPAPGPVRPGEATAQAGAAARGAFELGVRLVREGVASALATAPLDKRSLRMAGAPYIDHTSGLAQLTGADSVRTMFRTGSLRIFFVTRHLPLREAIDVLSVEMIVKMAAAAGEDLCRLGISNPQIALAALNPHASDGGLMGTEEGDILSPAVDRARGLGIQLHGPIPADAVFHLAQQGQFDAVLSLYHDQGHIAAKTLDFYGTVSFTFGLDFLRTSVDHGTAMDIAGRGIADSTSMVNAVVSAGRFGGLWRAPSR